MILVFNPVSWRQKTVFGLVVWFLLGAAGPSDNFPIYQDSLAVASINRDRLFNTSAYGAALRARLNTRQKDLVRENEALQKDLEREERELTDLRKQIPAEEFTPLAAAFDKKVNQIRVTQTGKSDQLVKDMDSARFAFFRQTEGVIKDLMVERGIRYVLNEQAILISTGEGDITDEVIHRLNELFDQGVLVVGDK